MTWGAFGPISCMKTSENETVMMDGSATKERRPRWKNDLISTGVVLIILAIIVVVIAVGMFVAEYGPAPFRVLPSDEEMIAHFHRHRADFERLIQIYREDPSLPNRFGMVSQPTPEMETITKRINVNWPTSDWTVWLPPDPYSEEARRVTKALQLDRKIHRGDVEGRKFSGVRIGYAHLPVRRFDKNMPEVFKGYYYTPFAPQIENGMLKKPVGGEWSYPSLNTYPSRLITGDCVYRQFEPQWFIRMCQ